MVLYENDIRYKDLESKEIGSLKLSCIVYGDNGRLSPITDLYINLDSNKVSIADINLDNHTGIGIGTCIINSLSKTLPQYGIKYISAGLSSKDYKVREKLYKFYKDYNGFEIISEIRENSWGLAKKKL